MRNRRIRLPAAATLLAAALPLALLSCDLLDDSGKHDWLIKGYATFNYPGPLPVPSGTVTLVMNVTRDGEKQEPYDVTWYGSYTNGELNIPNQEVNIGFEGDFYQEKAIWVLTTVNNGRTYVDTARFYPLLVIRDADERRHTMEFEFECQPPD